MSDYDMGDGGHVFLHLLSRSAPSEEPPQVAFSLPIGAEETIPNKHRTSTEQVPNKFDGP